MNDQLLSTEELADYIGRPVQTVYAMNHRGTGPRRIRVGRELRYRQSDVDRWLDSNAIDPKSDAE